MSWNCDTKYDVIQLFRDSNTPLDKELVLDLCEVDECLRVHGLSRRFVVLDTQCTNCGYKERSIAPEASQILECKNCGNGTMREREKPEWEQGRK